MEADQALIRVVHANGTTEDRGLAPGSYVIGRNQGDVQLPGDRNVSRRHARLDVAPGTVRITDLGSTCGTITHRGVRLQGTYLMLTGDSVLIGGGRVTLLKQPAGVPSATLPSTAVTQPELQAVVPDDEDG